jgi:hypothetical protein
MEAPGNRHRSIVDAVRAAPGLDTAGDQGRREVLPVLEALPSLQMIATTRDVRNLRNVKKRRAHCRGKDESCAR